MDCSPPGSSVHGILQARVLEWLPCPPPGDLPDPGIKPGSPAWQADSLQLSHQALPHCSFHFVLSLARCSLSKLSVYLSTCPVPALGPNLILWINVSDICWAYDCVVCWACRGRPWWISCCFSSNPFIYLKNTYGDLLYARHISKSTSVENILICLHIFLIRNIRVNCSFYIYKCYYGHFSCMCLPELLCRRLS